MTQQAMILKEEDYMNIEQYHKLFKISPQSITQQQRTYLGTVNDALWQIAGNKTKDINERIKHYGLIKLTHEILARKFDDSWIPRNDGKKSFVKRTITVEERIANCDSFVKYLLTRTIEDKTITVSDLVKIWSGSY